MKVDREPIASRPSEPRQSHPVALEPYFARHRVLTLNHISPRGLARLPPERYDVGPKVTEPVAILVRSADMHGLEITPSVVAIARAGAGSTTFQSPNSANEVYRCSTRRCKRQCREELVLAACCWARNIALLWPLCDRSREMMRQSTTRWSEARSSMSDLSCLAVHLGCWVWVR